MALVIFARVRLKLTLPSLVNRRAAENPVPVTANMTVNRPVRYSDRQEPGQRSLLVSDVALPRN